MYVSNNLYLDKIKPKIFQSSHKIPFEFEVVDVVDVVVVNVVVEVVVVVVDVAPPAQ